MKVYTIWGDSDSVIVYNDIKEKLNKLLPNRFENVIWVAVLHYGTYSIRFGECYVVLYIFALKQPNN